MSSSSPKTKTPGCSSACPMRLAHAAPFADFASRQNCCSAAPSSAEADMRLPVRVGGRSGKRVRWAVVQRGWRGFGVRVSARTRARPRPRDTESLPRVKAAKKRNKPVHGPRCRARALQQLAALSAQSLQPLFQSATSLHKRDGRAAGCSAFAPNGPAPIARRNGSTSASKARPGPHGRSRSPSGPLAQLATP